MLKKLVMIFSFILANSAFSQEQKMIGAIATGHPLATQAGLAVLEKGGNAFDAAIAVASTLNVVEPVMSGLGGYGSTLVYIEKDKQIRFLNSSGKFPAKANADLMRAPTPDYMKNRMGPKSISTPGNLNAWKEMHSKYGNLAWGSLFEDAIYYAKNGFAVPAYTAKLIADAYDHFPDYAKAFYGKNGRPLQENEILIQKDLAKTYELIAAKGVEPFYRGEIAKLIAKQMKEAGSFLSLEDLKADTAQWWDPIKISYRGYDIYTMGTPGNGFSALFALGVMEQFPLARLKYHSSEHLHTLAEVLKESCKVRLVHAGSPEERDNITDHILTAENFASIAKSIDKDKASDFAVPFAHESMNTTHFVVVDKWGNIVTSTQTLGYGFGSRVIIEGTGIWMNNSMAFSTFEPKGNPMDVLPGKYKLSSNSPVIIMKNNFPWAALGTPGGHTIPQNVAQIVMNLIDYNMNMQAAIEAPKIAFFEEDKVLCTEKGIESSVLNSLKQKGHVLDNENIAKYIGLSGKIGNAMGVRIVNNKESNLSFDIGIDRRKDAWSTNHLKMPINLLREPSSKHG